MEKWDKEESKSIINYIFIDETDSKSEQYDKVIHGTEFGKTNIVVDKTWMNQK